MRLTVRLTDSEGDEYDTSSVIVRASLIQTLRLRGILVSYNGPATSAMTPPGASPPPNLNLSAPTLANLQATAAISMRAMPVQATGSFASAGTLAWTLPLDDPRTSAGACSLNWNALLTALANQRTNDGNRADVVYYGLLPATIPLNVPGCGNNGLGAGSNGDQVTLMHEIGHGYGFAHTPCGAAGTTDANYPAYEPYASASIGEYGLDISNGNVLSPQTARDYMSYCGPQWMSLYQHFRLIGHARLDPRWLLEEPLFKEYFPRPIPDFWLPDPPPYQPWRIIDMQVNPVISITGIVHSMKEIEVSTVARVMAAGSPPGAKTRLNAQLVDSEGKRIAEGSLMRLNGHGSCACGCEGDGDPNSPPFSFQAFLPDAGAGASLRIMDGDEEVWSRQAPARPPQASITSAEASGEVLRLRWQVEAAVETPEVWAQWSADEGQTWQGLATNLSGNEASLALAGLPEGEIAVRILVHDGFFSAASEPARVTIPPRAPDVAIMHPAEGQTLYSGRTLNLWASATDSAGEPLPDDAVRWSIDGRDVGAGKELWLESPSAGEHTATVSARWPGGEVRQSVTFRTIGFAPYYERPASAY
jgi:hypothetical protein